MLFDTINKTLYQQDVAGTIREWNIKQDGNQIIIAYGILNGAIQTQVETINKGKAARTLQQQIESRILSRINKQLLKGYKESLAEAKRGRTNALGLIKPMLAQPLQKVKNINWKDTWTQLKYDGNRCLITNIDGQLIAYSRNGKIIDTIGHILKDMAIPEGTTLDGELYCHGYSLQELVSWIKRKQANTYLLRYHAYDLYSNEEFVKRFEKLNSFHLGESTDIVPTWHASEMDDITETFEHVKQKGYEGLILRTSGIGYEDGKRSKSLIKVKQFLDDEFLVINISLQEKSNRCVLLCEARNGKQFKVSAPGVLDNHITIYNNRANYIGQFVTVEYSILTADGIPFHAVAKRWRNKEAE